MGILFDPDRHADMVAALSRAAADIEGILDDLEAETHALRDHWSGTARDAYDRAHAQWSAAMAEIHAALQSAVATGAEIGDRLAQVEANALTQWQDTGTR